MLKLLKLLKAYKKESILSPVFKLVEVAFELTIPLLVANIIDVGIGTGNKPYIVKMCALMGLFGVLGLACTLAAQYFAAKAQARITELNGQINDTRTDLTAAQSEYDYLSTKMSDITSRASLQDVAEGQLGLVKADQSQITYIQLEEQSVIEKTGSDAGRVLVGIRTAALNLLDSFNP